jgi:hypothetical protein
VLDLAEEVVEDRTVDDDVARGEPLSGALTRDQRDLVDRRS